MPKILKVLIAIPLIILLFLIVGYIGLTIYGNIHQDGQVVIKEPDIAKAKYMVSLITAHKQLFTNDYDLIESGQYTLHGYWEIKDKKYIYRKHDLLLDEYYFGDIMIRKRE